MTQEAHVSAPRIRGRLALRPVTVTVVATAGVLAVATLAGATSSGPPGGAATPAVPASGAQLAGAGVGGPAASERDPSLEFSTFFGGRFWDEATDVDVDTSGNTYVTGFTLSQNLRHGGAAESTSFEGLSDAFVAKLSSDGRRVVWSRFLGGIDVDVANGMALDRAGNVYVTGRTASPDFPTTGGSFQPRLRGDACQEEPCHDAFVTKLNPNGGIVYSTLLGGTANEEGIGVAVDSSGSAYVTGNTDSADLPTRSAAQPGFQSPPCEGDLPCPYDVFASKLSPDGGSLVYSTYLGGDATETSGGIAVDSNNRAYVTGTTRSADFPSTRTIGSPMTVRRCGPPPGEPCLNAFVTKLGQTGSRIHYSTLLGGSKNEQGSGVAVDSAGAVVVTGSTESGDFPTRQAFQGRLDNASCLDSEVCADGFVSKLDPSGENLVYSTYLGGRAQDQGLAVALDRQGNAYVGGRTDSRNFPVRDAVQPRFGGYIDGFASSLSPGGSLRWSTFFGGKEADRVEGITIDERQMVRLAGRTLSPNFPTRHPVQGDLQDEDYDAFVAAIRSSDDDDR
jgi:hypothetical protein